MDPVKILTQAAGGKERPRSKELVAALLALEKQARRNRSPWNLERLQGLWRLRFVTGKARSQGGFYLPGLLQVTIHYQAETADTGRVENSVACGPLELQVTGPIRLYAARGILAFDFTQVQLKLLTRLLYGGSLRGGPASEREFARTSLAQQAFFSYFWTSPQAIAARGRGGGLALWSRAD
ncbi:MAG: hypothetical protein AAFY11_05330 [Cyanobacteria bacterium J06641_5]